jgi:hypothetical protein
MIRLLGFRAGRTFTLLRREAARPGAVPPDALVRLDGRHEEALVGLDAAVFGTRRPEWIGALLHDPEVEFFGIEKQGVLCAFAALRPRREGAWCLDLVTAARDETLDALVDACLRRATGRRIECFARAGSRLDARLLAAGFETPLFFRDIGPLTEWRKGRTTGVGDSDRMQCLSWF